MYMRASVSAWVTACIHTMNVYMGNICLMYEDLHFVQMIRVGLCKWLYKCMRSGLKSLHYTILQI